MQKTKNKSGLALTAIVAILSTMFGAVPAQANVESAAVITPTGAGPLTSNAILITEAFETRLRYGTGVVGANNTTAGSASGTIANANLHYSVDSTAAVVVASSPAVDGTYANRVGTSISATVANDGFVSIPSSSAFVRFSLNGLNSMSPTVDVTVTPYLELDGQTGMTAGDALGTPYVIRFVPWSVMGIAVSVNQPIANDTGATASFTVTAGTLRWSQLDSDLNLRIEQTGLNAATASATSPAQVIAGNYSNSASVASTKFTTSGTVGSVSATVDYGSASASPLVKVAVQAVQALGLSFSALVGANVTGSDVRFNAPFVVSGYAYNDSNTTSVSVARTVTVSSVTGMELNAVAGVVINGVTFTSESALLAHGFTLPGGTNTFAVSTFGQTNTGTDNIVLILANGILSQNLTLNLEPASLTPVYSPAAVAGLAGAAKTFALTVRDQFGQAPVRTDLRIASSVVLGGSTSETVSGAVSAGAATVTVTPVPATRTGSAVVTFTLEQFDQAIQQWLPIGAAVDTATWNLFTAAAAGSDAILSRTASISSSISYGVDLSWSSVAIAVGVRNTFSDVVVSAPGLMIRNLDNTTQTASDTLTIAANGNTANLQFTSRMAGTYTVTFTNGTATTTSQVIVNPARDADGATVTFDTTAIAAGSTKVITGTLRDINGNPVNTSGSATILVTYVPGGNAGIPIGTMPTNTDADGKFTITVLTGANDSGTAVVAAAYYKSGAVTPVAQVLTFNQSIVVGGAAAAPASDQKLTVGSFKGFVAIYALNYSGQKLSAKVAGKWLVVNSLTRFQRVVRNTGAAIPIVVDLYIDGTLIRTENIVTK